MNGCMGNGKKIQILLSTYNGEKYLREQLDSFLAQKNFEQCSVLIRDDGSTDDTWTILKEYGDRFGFQVERGEHKGTNASYQWLLNNSDPDCPFFAFSDQDDVWLPQKLSHAVEELERLPQEKVLLFASRSKITDEDLHPTGDSCDPVRGVSFYNAMVQNVLPGHTQVFNARLRDDLCRHGILKAHVVDWWVYLVAAAKGQIVFSQKYDVFHRQHGNNAVGYQLGALAGIRKKLKYIRGGKGNAISQQLQAFSQKYEGELPEEYQRELTDYLKGLGCLSKRLGYLRKSRVYRQEKSEDWKFRLLYAVGKYDLPQAEECGS